MYERTEPLFLSIRPDVQYVIASFAILIPLLPPPPVARFDGYAGAGV